MVETGEIYEHDIDASGFPSFKDYLKEIGRYEQVTHRAEKMAIAIQIARQMEEQKITKSEMAARMR